MSRIPQGFARYVPVLTIGYATGNASNLKRYGSKASVYYQMAKWLVCRKYSPILAGEYETDLEAIASELKLTPALVELRRSKMFALYYNDDDPDGRPPYFNSDKWSKFVRRVAKFLAFVDKRRTAVQLLAHYDDHELARRYQLVETQAGMFMSEMVTIREELKQRGVTVL